MNKTKRGLEIASVIIIIILSILDIIGSVSILYFLITESPEGNETATIGLCISLFLILILLLLSFILLPSPSDSNLKARKDVHVIIVIFLVLLIIVLILFVSILDGILFIIPLGLFIGVLCTKDSPQNITEENVVKSEESIKILESVSMETLEEKIKKFHELKESGMISEEQYQTAIKKLIDKM